MDKVSCFANELVFIKNENIRKFAEKAIESLPDYFFHVAASSTGKYHPAYSLGEGGLLRHTRAAVRIAIELFRTDLWSFTDDEKDLILATLMVHDGYKHGKFDGRFTVTEHPNIVSFAIKENMELESMLSPEYMEIIHSGLRRHMGKWSYDYKTKQEVLEKPETKIDKYVHICDYLASRRCLEMKFDVELSRE